MRGQLKFRQRLESNGIDATPSGGALLGFMPVELDERYYFFQR